MELLTTIEFFGMSLNEVLLVTAVILILIDIFFASDIPTHIAYVIITFTVAKEFDVAWLYQVMFAILIWFGLVIFHYTIWGKLLEKINDRFIAPRHHIGGIEGLVGETGIIKEVEGNSFVIVNEELHSYVIESDRKVSAGDSVKIKSVKSNKLIIH